MENCYLVFFLNEIWIINLIMDRVFVYRNNLLLSLGKKGNFGTVGR